MRRLSSVGVLLVALALLLAAAPLGAQSSDEDAPSAAETAPPDETADPGFVTVIEVNGLLDDILVDFIATSIEAAERSGARYLIIHLDSPGAVVSDEVLVDLARQIRDAEVPVATWVGPSGSQALGGAAQLASVTEPIGVSIGARIGRTGESILPEDEFGPLFGDAGPALIDATAGHERVLDLEVAPEQALTLGLFALTLPGFESIEVVQDGEPTLEPRTAVQFRQLDLPAEIFHTVASPEVTYLLLIIGLSLIIFELFTAGVGIAGMVGAGSLVMSAYGLWALPVRPWTLALMLVAFFGFAVDVQTGVPRAWTVIGGVLFTISSFWFYDAMSISWITLLVAFIGVALTFLAGMPAMVRTRFSTPTIGREWMIGEAGVASGEVAPDGLVLVRDAPWRAHTNRATPIGDGEAIRVVAIDGMVLEVEPEEGGARDYRDRS